MTARPSELLEQSLVRFWHAPTSAAPGGFGTRFGSNHIAGTIPGRLFAGKVKGVYWQRLGPFCASWPPCPGMFPGALNLLVEIEPDVSSFHLSLTGLN